MSIGEKIKELREEQQLSQYQLALALQLPRYILSNIEQGRTEPNIDHLVKLANYFQCSVDELLGREDYGTGNVVVQGATLSTFDERLLQVVHNLSPEDQFQVLGFAQALAK